MARRPVIKPRVSVLLSVHDAVDELSRSVESVLRQELHGFELVIADCASTDQTRRLIDSFVEHDIRVDAVTCPTADPLAGYARALERARGTYAIFLGQGDWLSPTYLVDMLAAADGCGAQVAFPAVSCDTLRADGGRSCLYHAPAAHVWRDAPAFRQGLGELISQDAFLGLSGKLVEVARVRESGLELDGGAPLIDLAVAYLQDVERACAVPGACCHVVTAESCLRGRHHAGPVFDPARYDRCEHVHASLMGLYGRWGLDDDPVALEPLHRMHLSQVISCIENACVGSGRLSSIERRQRVQDIIDAPSTRCSIKALRSSAKEFGIMFSPIARRSAAACLMGARIQDIICRTLAPLGAARPSYS